MSKILNQIGKEAVEILVLIIILVLFCLFFVWGVVEHEGYRGHYPTDPMILNCDNPISADYYVTLDFDRPQGWHLFSVEIHPDRGMQIIDHEVLLFRSEQTAVNCLMYDNQGVCDD